MRSVEDHPGPILGHAEAHRGEYREEQFLEVLREVSQVLEGIPIPYAFMGGLASTTHGRPRWTHDVDIFVKPQDALGALDALKAQGYETERTDEAWLYKAFKNNVMVDVIFKSRGNIYFDDEMFQRSVIAAFRGVRLRFVPPEDLVVIKARVSDEVGPRHWFDALAILATSAVDWEYLLRRARIAPRRVLSLLLYAQSSDLMIPNTVVRRLFAEVMES